MIPFQILPWGQVKALQPMPLVVKVTENDLQEFQLPVPGLWKKIIAGESTPGIPSKDRDKSLPARTHVIGVIDSSLERQVVYLKDEILQHGTVKNEELNFYLVAVGKTVNGFKSCLNAKSLDLQVAPDHRLTDKVSGTVWDVRGKYVSGEYSMDLVPVAISDSYWFAWKRFHPKSVLISVS
jgi:uncharacterized radical SAM superfamily Fe-S cluster-containing enzyme